MKHAVYRVTLRQFSPAAFGRLCVETVGFTAASMKFGPAAFGRLCVETVLSAYRKGGKSPSRLRAAVC